NCAPEVRFLSAPLAIISDPTPTTFSSNGDLYRSYYEAEYIHLSPFQRVIENTQQCNQAHHRSKSMIPIKDYPGPRRRIPWVTWTLITINIVVFLYQVSLGPAASAFMFAYSVVPIALTHGIPQTSLPGVPANLPFHTPNPVYLTVLTSMFLHAG